MKIRKQSLFAGLIGLAALSAVPSPAWACGGFFCSQAQPVNQAAERIIFAENGDGTVTAIIQILYEGPSESFSWLLPISSVPTGDMIGVASDIAFQRLQSRTNPSYSLQTTVEGTCLNQNFPTSGLGGATSSPGGPISGPPVDDGEGGVNVEAMGVIGKFEYTVLSVTGDPPDPASVAVDWLEANEYDIGEGAPSLIRPYLEDGNFLLALRLVKGSDTGSIRPIVLTYEAAQPMIPIKLTAVAANDDMGVMAWLLSDARGVASNYKSLELNEAKINWFNAAQNYQSVVIDAANESGGQGFVTEFAGSTSTLAGTVWTSYDESIWQSFSSTVFSSFDQIFQTANSYYGSYDGFWDAVSDTVTLPLDVPFEDFRICPTCYSGQIEFSPAAFMTAIEEGVIAPLRDVQDLIDRFPYVTRLYSTLSAAEMTVDPLFTFNSDLDDVSNIHTAMRIIECSPDVDINSAPWRIELPQGGVIRGLGSNIGSWPALDDMPSNQRILQLSSSGDGMVAEDNAEVIETMLDEYNQAIVAVSGGTPGAGGSNTGGRSGGTTSTGGRTGGMGGSGGDGGTGGEDEVEDDSGCSLSIGSPRGAPAAWLGAGALALLWLHGRRRPTRRRLG